MHDETHCRLDLAILLCKFLHQSSVALTVVLPQEIDWWHNIMLLVLLMGTDDRQFWKTAAMFFT